MWVVHLFEFDMGPGNNRDLSIFQGSRQRIRSMAGSRAFGIVHKTQSLRNVQTEIFGYKTIPSRKRISVGKGIMV